MGPLQGQCASHLIYLAFNWFYYQSCSAISQAHVYCNYVWLTVVPTYKNKQGKDQERIPEKFIISSSVFKHHFNLMWTKDSVRLRKNFLQYIYGHGNEATQAWWMLIAYVPVRFFKMVCSDCMYCSPFGNTELIFSPQTTEIRTYIFYFVFSIHV